MTSPDQWTWMEWIAWLGIVLPLFTLAFSGWRYVSVRKQENCHQQYQRFFEITDHLGSTGGSIASKMAAAYELRKYPQYKDVIIRLCDGAVVDGPAAEMLNTELRLTAENMRSL